MNNTSLFAILIGGLLVNNFVLSQFLGICPFLGVTILNIDKGYDFGQSLVNALGAGLGFLLAMVMFAGVRERLESAEIPAGLKGLPITLVAASLVSMSFLGFQGLFGL